VCGWVMLAAQESGCARSLVLSRAGGSLYCERAAALSSFIVIS
jgi:hypothetical protein